MPKLKSHLKDGFKKMSSIRRAPDEAKVTIVPLA